VATRVNIDYQYTPQKQKENWICVGAVIKKLLRRLVGRKLPIIAVKVQLKLGNLTRNIIGNNLK